MTKEFQQVKKALERKGAEVRVLPAGKLFSVSFVGKVRYLQPKGSHMTVRVHNSKGRFRPYVVEMDGAFNGTKKQALGRLIEHLLDGVSRLKAPVILLPAATVSNVPLPIIEPFNVPMLGKGYVVVFAYAAVSLS